MRPNRRTGLPMLSSVTIITWKLNIPVKACNQEETSLFCKPHRSLQFHSAPALALEFLDWSDKSKSTARPQFPGLAVYSASTGVGRQVCPVAARRLSLQHGVGGFADDLLLKFAYKSK
ncbi:hypothetical protein BV898_01251 [Hypsibius exemplaris]|uniref:Uncharacterized protein n=1 Tax=Hypsibius exemplaris TaxID=2072580 RepID=A0A1W0XC56_HYPEX|nr:hypothetical protein BV898_01251 [Hypsibius exemplaris]